MEQDCAVMTSATERQDLSLSLTVGFYNSLNAHKALNLLFQHLFHEPHKKRTFGIAYSGLMTKINNGTFDFFTFTATFIVLFPEQCFHNSRKVSSKQQSSHTKYVYLSREPLEKFKMGASLGKEGLTTQVEVILSYCVIRRFWDY